MKEHSLNLKRKDTWHLGYAAVMTPRYQRKLKFRQLHQQHQLLTLFGLETFQVTYLKMRVIQARRQQLLGCLVSFGNDFNTRV